jgi:hypothetical protein
MANETENSAASIAALLATLDKAVAALALASAPRARRAPVAADATPGVVSEVDRVIAAANVRRGNRRDVLRYVIPLGVGDYPATVVAEACKLGVHEVMQAADYLGKRFAEIPQSVGYTMLAYTNSAGAKFVVLGKVEPIVSEEPKVLASEEPKAEEPVSEEPKEQVSEEPKVEEPVSEEPKRRNRR